MCAGPSGHDFVMQFIHVESNCKDQALGQDIIFSTIQISAEVHVLFYICKGALRLDTAVHSELCPIITGYT